MEVYDILNVRGAMNCATTNKEVRELRDYERVYGGVNERGVFFLGNLPLRVLVSIFT